MKTQLTALGVAAALLLPAPRPASTTIERSRDNIVLQWNVAALQGVRDAGLGPPMAARALAIVHTCMYDAWAAYDPVAIGTRYGGALRRPARQRSLPNKVRAISFAAYRATVDLLPADRTTVFAPLMHGLGYDIDTTTDLNRAAGVGNVACQAVLDYRHHDGANQLGDHPGGTLGVPYSDYIGYQPVNGTMDLTGPFDPATVHNPNRWQPLQYRNSLGALVTPGYLAPYWNRVLPFALPTDSAMRSSAGPAGYRSPRYRAQALALLNISAHLTDERKVIAEYWADGPGTDLPSGHWDVIAQYVSRRDHHGIDADTKLFFALTNAIFDASIVAWDDKRAFDSERPITAIRYLFHGRTVMAWAGPYRGTRLIDGGRWLPYQAATFPTPPFPEYTSGHSTFSAAAAEVLRLATGSDRFGASVTIAAGSSKIEPGAVPTHEISLSWPTFTDAANQASLSRRYGGIHFQQADMDGRATGRACADMAWAAATRYFHDSA
jgi:hypothetical protein